MHLRHRPLVREVSQVHLFDKIPDVRIRDGMIFLNDNVAAAVQAKPLAERNVNVNRKRRRGLSESGDQHP
jgi:hypothetical protein